MIKDVSIEITQKCMNHCIHCSSCSSKECDIELPFKTILNVIKGLKRLNTERICLSGGEPFLHPEIIRIIEQITSFGMIVDVYSCGIIEENGKTKALPCNLLCTAKNAGLRTIIFNVPSSKEDIYDLVTETKGHFPLLCESIKNTIECGIKAEIHYVPLKQNIDSALSVIDFAEQMKIQQVNFLKLVPHGRALENAEKITLDNSRLTNLCNQVNQLKKTGKLLRLGLPLSSNDNSDPCHAVKEKIYIKFDGSVFGCEAFKYIKLTNKEGTYVLPDNIHNKSIEEIYYNSCYLKLSRKFVEKYAECQIGCENCPVQKYIKEKEELK